MDDAQPVQVIMEAPASCATERALWREVARRTDRARRADGQERAAVVRMSVGSASSPPGVAGTLEVAWGPDAAPSEMRRVEGESCEEVVSALGLMMALVFDPTARAEVDARPPPPPPPVSTRRAEGWRWALGAHGGAVAADGIAPRLGAFVDTAARRTALRLWIFGAESTRAGGPGDARIRWLGGRLDGCPAAAATERVALRSCATLEGGVLSGVGRGVEAAREITRPWIAAGLAARLEWTAADALRLEVEVGAAAPFVRDGFRFDPSQPLYETPVIVGHTSAGVGFRFP